MGKMIDTYGTRFAVRIVGAMSGILGPSRGLLAHDDMLPR